MSAYRKTARPVAPRGGFLIYGGALEPVDCLDAPDHIPAGSCRGTVWRLEIETDGTASFFGRAATQRTVKRGEA